MLRSRCREGPPKVKKTGLPGHLGRPGHQEHFGWHDPEIFAERMAPKRRDKQLLRGVANRSLLPEVQPDGLRPRNGPLRLS